MKGHNIDMPFGWGRVVAVSRGRQGPRYRRTRPYDQLASCGPGHSVRRVCQVVLRALCLREDQEKLNVWVALLNLENLYGSADSLAAVLQRALQANDPRPVYRQLISIYTRSDKTQVRHRRSAPRLGVGDSAGSNGIDIAVSRHRTVSVSHLQLFLITLFLGAVALTVGPT